MGAGEKERDSYVRERGATDPALTQPTMAHDRRSRCIDTIQGTWGRGPYVPYPNGMGKKRVDRATRGFDIVACREQ